MKIRLYLTGVFALFVALPLLALPGVVEAQGSCAGGKCGITTTCSPNSGPTGTQVTISITSGGYPLDGKYEVWWSKTPNMAEGDPTVVKVAEGFNERLKQTVSMAISVPEATSGTNYLHYVRAGRADQMMSFTFQVTPSIILQEEKVSAGQTVTIRGTGFTPLDTVTFYLDGEPLKTTVRTSELGSFTADLPLPDLQAGTHVIKATADKMFNQEATLRLKTAPSIRVEPATPVVGKTATVSGSGFAPETEVSIKFGDQSVASSPVTDKRGCFTYEFTVPEVTANTHIVTATDRLGNTAIFEPAVENNPPTAPTPVAPASDRFGLMGKQQVTFIWLPATDDSGRVTYTLEVGENLNFFPLAPGMRRTDLTEPAATMELPPGTYYWRVQAIDPSGNKSKWVISPFSFQVGMISTWVIIAAGIVLLIIFVLLLRAFINRLRGYYY